MTQITDATPTDPDGADTVHTCRLDPLISPAACMQCLPVEDVGMQCTDVLVHGLARIEYQARIAPRLVSSADLDHLLPR